jgi:hypothetical protein
MDKIFFDIIICTLLHKVLQTTELKTRADLAATKPRCQTTVHLLWYVHRCSTNRLICLWCGAECHGEL